MASAWVAVGCLIWLACFGFRPMHLLPALDREDVKLVDKTPALVGSNGGKFPGAVRLLADIPDGLAALI